ncbi:MAG TPA: hypothetical protein VFH97_08715, partial [Gemmatimonadales bacterium]|nr:hypothetical protein [Gemmatimonadales bacterium]
LAETINRSPAEVVIVGTPIDLRRLVSVEKPVVRIRYELEEVGRPRLDDVLRDAALFEEKAVERLSG